MDKDEIEEIPEGKLRRAEIVGLIMMFVILSMFVLDAFGFVMVREVWIWPLLLTAAALILGLRRPFRRV